MEWPLASLRLHRGSPAPLLLRRPGASDPVAKTKGALGPDGGGRAGVDGDPEVQVTVRERGGGRSQQERADICQESAHPAVGCPLLGKVPEGAVCHQTLAQTVRQPLGKVGPVPSTVHAHIVPQTPDFPWAF